MQWTGLNELREKYLSFFESKGHLRLDSFPLVPKNDPSLLLINSGMAPMKKWFLAQEEPPRHRVTTCQKCIRTPDIERVGITARHGTFFEMLGNFSFQDYFKEEVIPWAWEFLTSDEWMAIPKDKLHISVYKEDDEAYDIWTKKVGVAPDHMVRLGKEDNFWEHGSGPCGPCSEIYFDRGPEYGCGKPTCGVGCDCDRYMEIWNLVFSQFDADGKGHYERLARPNIDTGMGLDVIEKLNNHKVNTRFIKKVPDGMGTWLAIFDNDGDVHAAISKRPDTTPLTTLLEEKGDEIFKDCDAIAIELDLEKDTVKQVLRYARKYNKKVFAAVSNMSIAMERRDYLQQIDCFVCNQQEAGLLFSDDYEHLAPSQMAQVLARNVHSANMPSMVVTMGGKGAAFARANGECGIVPAKKVDVIDTTGAGDAFFAGTVIGLTYGKTLAESCEIGSRLAASVICITENVCPRFRPLEFGLDIPVVD